MSFPHSPLTRASIYAASSLQGEPLRYGILGTGKIAEDFANAILPCKDIILHAIGSRSKESADAFGDMFKIPHRYSSYSSLVNDPRIDVIYIGTPTEHHFSHAVLALNAGKHVLLEKSFTSSHREAVQLIQLAKEKQKFLGEAMWTRWCPAINRAIQLVRDGTIGDVHQVSMDFGCAFPAVSGALAAVGCYNLALSQMIFDAQRPPFTTGELIPTKVLATGRMRAGTQVDEHLSMIVTYSDSKHSTSSASLLVETHKEALIVGTKGRIRLPGPLWHSTDTLIVEVEGKPEEKIEFKGLELELQEYARPFRLLNSQRLIYQCLEVNRCIRLNLIESPMWTHAQIARVQHTMDRVRCQLMSEEKYGAMISPAVAAAAAAASSSSISAPMDAESHHKMCALAQDCLRMIASTGPIPAPYSPSYITPASATATPIITSHGSREMCGPGQLDSARVIAEAMARMDAHGRAAPMHIDSIVQTSYFPPSAFPADLKSSEDSSSATASIASSSTSSSSSSSTASVLQSSWYRPVDASAFSVPIGCGISQDSLARLFMEGAGTKSGLENQSAMQQQQQHQLNQETISSSMMTDDEKQVMSSSCASVLYHHSAPPSSSIVAQPSHDLSTAFPPSVPYSTSVTVYGSGLPGNVETFFDLGVEDPLMDITYKWPSSVTASHPCKQGQLLYQLLDHHIPTPINLKPGKTREDWLAWIRAVKLC